MNIERVELTYTGYKIQDILFPIHGPHKDIIGTNIQRKNHNYIEYSYTMTYLSQHIKSNKQVINNNHVVFVARLLSLMQIIYKSNLRYYNYSWGIHFAKELNKIYLSKKKK